MKHKLLIYILPSLLLLTILSGLFFSRANWKKQARSYEEQIRITRKELSSLQLNQELLKQNSTQIRQYMNLPALVFEEDFDDSDSQNTQGPRQGNFELAAYGAVAYLNEHNSYQDTLRTYSSLLKEEPFTSLLKQLDLTYRKTVNLRGVLRKADNEYFTVEFQKDSNEFHIKNILNKSEIIAESSSFEFISFLQQETEKLDELYAGVERLNRELMTLYQDRDLKDFLKEFQLSLGKAITSGKTKAITVLRIDDSPLITMQSDIASNSFALGDNTFESLDELKKGLRELIRTKDIRTDAKIQDDLVEGEIKALLKDPAFLQRLKDLGLTPGSTSREDDDYIYYDLIDSQNEAKGALALQKEFAEVYLMDGDDIPVRSLKTFTRDHTLSFNFQLETEEEPQFSENYQAAQGSKTFLLIGSHEHNADTMILLHADSSAGEMRMLSIPRDLYYQGRKINSIYRKQGVEPLLTALSSVTGLDIRDYVAIDMYAFIDVVNILGGIKVTLDEALVDPSYKVRENGRWSTLYYTAGTHHLDGIAALRIARSRHTSSDFERSVRQQKVIAALKNSLTTLGLTNINKIYDIIQTSGKYVQSNLSTADMVKYFLSYKDYEISGQHVMNTDNVLYATYTNLYRLTEDEQKKALEDPNFYKGGWIVLPKNNEWSIIKTYIRSVLTS